MVWKTSTKLGIGYARTSDRTRVFVVARYKEHGNVGGRYLINVPKPSYILNTFQDNCLGNSDLCHNNDNNNDTTDNNFDNVIIVIINTYNYDYGYNYNYNYSCVYIPKIHTYVCVYIYTYT